MLDLNTIFSLRDNILETKTSLFKFFIPIVHGITPTESLSLIAITKYIRDFKGNPFESKNRTFCMFKVEAVCHSARHAIKERTGYIGCALSRFGHFSALVNFNKAQITDWGSKSESIKLRRDSEVITSQYQPSKKFTLQPGDIRSLYWLWAVIQ